MLTLTRQGLLLSLSATVIPSQGSSDVPVAVVNDINTYVGYTLEPRVGYYLNGIYKSTVCTYDTSAKTFSVPAEAFKQIGIIDITLALIDNANANHIETCQTVHATVNKAPLGTVVLPDQTTWQEYVRSYTQGFLNDYTTTTIDPLVTQAQQAVTTANQASNNANQASQTANKASQNVQTAYNNLGNYKVENGVLYFMKADGTYNQQGITLAGQSTILDGQNNPILNGSMTPQDNLLINSDFRSGIINQKGQTQYVHSSGARTYGIDCWYVTGENSSMAINDKFLSLNLHNNGDFGYVLDIVKDNEKYLTFTIKQNLEEEQSVTFDVSTMNVAQDYFFDIDENTKLGIYFWDTDNRKQAWLYIRRNGITNIDFMKLERGKYFTGMPVWNKAIELSKCLPYYQKGYIGGTDWTTFANKQVIFTVNIYPMVKKPSVKFTQVDNYKINHSSVAAHDERTLAVTYEKNGETGGLRYGISWEADAYDY